MKKYIGGLAVFVGVSISALLPAKAGTNGFIVPLIRNTATSQYGYWESFNVPVGVPGNLPDGSGSTTGAVLTQSDTNAIMAGSGNLYNQSGVSAFTLKNETPFTLGTVVLQARSVGTELDYNSVSLIYTNDNGQQTRSPLFRYELSRISAGPGQGFAVSSIWQWDLTGLAVTNYTIVFEATDSSLSFDSMTLDTADTFAKAFAEQPFAAQSKPADIARWSYLASDFTSANRATVSVFGASGNQPDFDTRDAQYLLGWNTTNRVPAGQGAKNYLVRRARVTLTISGNQYSYTGVLRDYRTYFPTNDPRYIATTNTSSPVELYGTGFRGGFTNDFNMFVPWASTNYPQTGPWSSTTDEVYYEVRAAYSAGYNTNGVLVDVANNVGDDTTNEISSAFEVAPFAVGNTTNVVEGEVMPAGSQLTFDLNLDDPLIYAYLQKSLNDGELSLMASTLIGGSREGVAVYPAFYTIFSPIATSQQVPLLDLEGEVMRSTPDSDTDGLSDDWENFYFGSLANNGTADTDGDGASNVQEFQAGSTPNSTTNVLRVFSIQYQTNQTELHFAHAPSRQYSIGFSDDLLTWQTNSSPTLFYSSAWLSKTGTNLSYPSPVYAGWRDTNASSPKRFYRIGAQ